MEQICQQTRDCQVAALSDAKLPNIETTGGPQGRGPRLHTVLSTSDIHLQHQLRITREQALEMAVDAVRLGRKLIPEVEFSAMDARARSGYLCRASRPRSTPGRP